MRKANLKRVFKISFLSLLFLLVLFVLGVVAWRVFYLTDEKIREIAAQTLAQKFSRELEIESLNISILSGMQIRGLRIYDPSSRGGEIFLQLERLELRYHLLSLLKRQLEIRRIAIEEPKIYVRQFSDGLWNFSDLLEPKRETSPAATDSTQPELPLRLVLNSLEVKDASLHLSGPCNLDLSGVSFALESLSFLSPDDFSVTAHFRISAEERENLHLTSISTAPEVKVSGNLGVSFSGEIGTDSPSTGKVEFSLAESGIYSGKAFPPLSLGGGMKLFYDINADSLRLDEIHFELNENSLLKAEASLTSLRAEPRFRFVSASNAVKLSRFCDLVNEFAPGAQIDGEAYWENIWAEGDEEKINAGLSFGLRDLTAQDSATGLTVEGLGLEAKIEAEISAANLDITLGLSGDFSLHEVKHLLPDSPPLAVGGIGGRFAAEVEGIEEGMPNLKSAIFEAEAKDLFGGSASLAAILESPQAGLSGTVSIQNVQFNQLPQSPIIGSGGVRLDFTASDFDDIVCRYQLFTDSIKCHLQDDSLVLEPLKFSGDARLSANEDFSQINLEDLSLVAPGLLDLVASGGLYNFGQDSLKASLQAKVKHDRLSDFLPRELNRALGGLEFAGVTEVRSAIKGRLTTSGIPELDVNTDLGLTDFGMIIPAFDTEVRGLGGEVNLALESNRVDLEGLFRLDWIENYNYLTNPLSDCFLTLKASLTNLPGKDQSDKTDVSLFLENFQFDCLSHKFGLTLSGLVSNLGGSPNVKLGGSFDFRSPQEMTLLPEVKAKGGLSMRMNITMRDSIVTLFGSTDFQYLNLEMLPLVSIENMNGHIPFYQKFDLGEMSLIQETERQSGIYSSSPFNYERLRAYNLHTSENISNFRIETVTVMRFSAQNLEMDVAFGNSGLYIPRVVGNLYDGNLYGNLEVNLKSLKLGGKQLELEEVDYSAYLQFSSVNFSEMTGLGEEIITEEKSLTGDVRLRGRGLLPQGELEAEVNITQVSAEVLSRILDFLDPEGTDPGFAMTKTFLDQKFKVIGLIPIKFRPRWFSCPIRHGNIYPSLYADIYSPLPFIRQLIRLPMPIRYDRIPLSVVLAQVGAPEEEF